VVADGAQCRHDRSDRRVPESDGPAIRIGKVNMADERSGPAQRRRQVRLLNVHVKEVSENLDIARVQCSKPLRRVAEAVKQIRFVTVEGLEEEG